MGSRAVLRRDPCVAAVPSVHEGPQTTRQHPPRPDRADKGITRIDRAAVGDRERAGSPAAEPGRAGRPDVRWAANTAQAAIRDELAARCAVPALAAACPQCRTRSTAEIW